MKITSIETFQATLPFRFSFGHSLASRAHSTNLIVAVRLSNGITGYGEGVPRDYVTGEDVEAACLAVDKVYAPAWSGEDVSDQDLVLAKLAQCFSDFELGSKMQGASWCAFELAVLDAVAKAHSQSLADWLGPQLQSRIRYGGVIPFANKYALFAMLVFYRACGFKTVKIKVGKDTESDRSAVAMARQVMGEAAIIRVDANCAWSAEQTLKMAERLRPYRVASYEQPVAANDLKGLQKVTASIPEEVLVDESLCTLAQAKLLSSERMCTGFNIRLSKVGGILAAQKIVAIAKSAGLQCHLGAQVGESGILSAAHRIFAMINDRFANYEGAANRLLLRKDLTAEDLTCHSGGYADLSYRKAQPCGLGVSVDAAMLSPCLTPGLNYNSYVGSATSKIAAPTSNHNQSGAGAVPRQIPERGI